MCSWPASFRPADDKSDRAADWAEFLSDIARHHAAAKIEINVLIWQCLNRRIETIGEVRREVSA